ncbi:MAG: hydroxyacid dehydrogenase [Saccharofermentanales bacterium]
MKKVVIAQKTNPSVVAMLAEKAEIAQVDEGSVEDLKEKLKGAYAVFLGTWVKFTAELMDISPDLKVISRTGVGVDNVDIAAATKRGIMVLNTPYANAVSVAEHAVTLMLALAKQLFFLDSSIRTDNFKARRLNLPVDIDSKTLGLIGCGGIGRLVAQKCRNGFNMNVLGYDPYLKTAPEEIELVNQLEEIYRRSDFVSIHLPLTEETRNLINAYSLAHFKSSAILINTSRGGIVDEAALAQALEAGKIAGAGLDVFAQEPVPLNSPLMTARNLIMTPHSAALTQECVVRVATAAAEGIIQAIEGREPEFVFNRRELANR